MSTTHNIFYIQNINKNFPAWATKNFPEQESDQAWIEILHKVSQAAILLESNQAKVILQFVNFNRIILNSDSLFLYNDRKSFPNKNN